MCLAHARKPYISLTLGSKVHCVIENTGKYSSKESMQDISVNKNILARLGCMSGVLYVYVCIAVQ